MRKYLILLLLCLALPLQALALESPIYDGANILTTAQEADLAQALDRFSRQYNAQIVIATVPHMGGYEADDFTFNFYDNNNIGMGSSRSGILLLLAMEERDCRILACGEAQAAIGDWEIDAIHEAIVDDLSSGNYQQAFFKFIEQCNYYMEGHINGFPFPAERNLKICLIIGAVIAVIVTIILYAQLKSVKKQFGAGAYTRPGSMQLNHSSDLFLYRNVSRVKIESSSSSGGGGGSRSIGGGKF